MDPSYLAYAEYLSLPAGFGPPGGLVWDRYGDCLEQQNNQTFLFTKQLADFIEGFASVANVLHFGHMLECWHMLSMEPTSPFRDRFRPVAIAFRQQNSPARNAGVFFAGCTEGVARAVNVPPGGGMAIARFLSQSNDLGMLHPSGPGNNEVPDRSAHDLWQHVSHRLESFRDEELRRAFRRAAPANEPPPETKAEAVVELIKEKPPGLGEFLDAAIRDRERLRNSLPMVRQLLSALTLPARRVNSQKLPIGGYSDVTNRGRPERLLLSQFALDSDEFIRRFAENELLYFDKEDPHERSRETLSIVLDQGVRTWGGIRPILAAAVLALAQRGDQRGQPITVRLTSAPGELFQPPNGDPVRFGAALEASDLSPHPAEALEREIADDQSPCRDIVLLTHPAALNEAAIRPLPARLPKNHRLFALAVTEEREAELSELRPGGAVSIRRLRIDPPSAESKPSITFASTPAFKPWTGDAERIPYPFRMGPIHGIEHLCFDADGENLLLSTTHGFLYLFHITTKEMEMLPRAIPGGRVPETLALCGLRDGFVTTVMDEGILWLFHYRLSTRRVTRYELFAYGASRNNPIRFVEFPDLDCVFVSDAGEGRTPGHGYTLDLGTGARHPNPGGETGLTARAIAASEKARKEYRRWCESVPIYHDYSDGVQDNQPHFFHDEKTGKISLVHSIFGVEDIPIVLDQHVGRFLPLSDGKPIYRESRILRVHWAENTIAVASTKKKDHEVEAVWRVFDLRDGKLLAETPCTPYKTAWLEKARLSRDGKQLAWKIQTSEVTILQPFENGNRIQTSRGHCHSNVLLELSRHQLDITIGKEVIRFDWKDAEARIARLPRESSDSLDRLYARVQPFGRLGPHRFRFSVESGRLTASVDLFGQVVLENDNQVVAIVFVYLMNVCFWMPDGTRYGPTHLTGGPATPDALRNLAAALRAIDPVNP